MTLEPGVQIGSYRVDGELGRGGMGVVYRATDTRLDRPVAIKFLSAMLLDENARRRFEREARTASALNHPHILTVHDVGDYAGAQYFVTEFIDGGTLEDWLAGEPRTWRQCVELMIGVADALAAAHAANVLHRDVKPANILVSRSGYAKLADFGLAKPAIGADSAATANAALTEVGGVIGTLAYMSPEQVAGRALDARSDIFAFGIVLYEMLAGRRPFAGDSDFEVMLAVKQAAPAPLPSEIPDAVRAIVDKAIEKDPAERYQSMRDLVVDLKRAVRKTPPPAAATVVGATARVGRAGSPARQHRRRSVVAAVALLVVAAVGAGYVAWNRSAQARWARDEAIPTIARLTDEGSYREAFALAEQATRYAPNDSLLRTLTPLFSMSYTVTSTPSEALVLVRGYADTDEDWQVLGRTPLPRATVARRPLRWRFEKDGFEPAEFATALEYQSGNPGPNRLEATLQPVGTEPGMVFVPAGGVAQRVNSVAVQAPQIGPFFIDRYEVTNAAYKEFVDAGGYEQQRFWAGLDLRRDGAPLEWQDAMRLFVDTTGRAGPASWELGDHPAGQEQYPVTGISWYEAAAYARFRGKSLATVYHWAKAALPGDGMGSLAASFVPASNYGTSGPAAVGSYRGFGPYGTYDMQGNVSEWTANHATAAGRAWVLGGSFRDAAYNFSAALSVPLLERSDAVGFRLVRDAGTGVPARLLEPLDLERPRLTSRQPASDEVYAAYAQQFVYRSGDLNATAPVTVETTDDWLEQRVTVDTGYGERMDIVLFVPTQAQPPYQALVYFPPFDAVNLPGSSEALTPGHPVGGTLDFIVKSGRVIVQPIYQGTYERFREPLRFGDELAMQRRWVDWRWDMGRALDYLETRADIDARRIGYAGVSFGAALPLHLPALESRFRAALLIAGGLFVEIPPSLDPVHYARRITMPVLMVNGRYDYIIPIDAQNVLFDLLGTPPAQKRHVLVETGHLMLRSDLLRESLGWLDESLGPVR